VLDDRLVEGFSELMGGPAGDLIERRYVWGPLENEAGAIILQEQQAMVSQVSRLLVWVKLMSDRAVSLGPNVEVGLLRGEQPAFEPGPPAWCSPTSC
jgi:hypothetical protein